MKRWLSLPLFALLLSACISPPPVGEGLGEGSATPAPTRTPTLAPTATVTFTPTPEPTGVDVLGPELAEKVSADFEKFGYPLDDLTFQQTEKGVVAFDTTGEVTGEKGKVVYENGMFGFKFAVLKLDPNNLMPTKYKWDEKFISHPYAPTNEVIGSYLRPLASRTVAEFRKIFGSDYEKIRQKVSLSDLMLNPETLSWGMVYFFDGVNITGFLQSTHLLVYETKNSDLVFVPLIPNFNYLNVGSFWAGR